MKLEKKIKRDNNTSIVLYTLPLAFNENNSDCTIYIKIKRQDSKKYVYIQPKHNRFENEDEVYLNYYKQILQWVSKEEYDNAKNKFIRSINKNK